MAALEQEQPEDECAGRVPPPNNTSNAATGSGELASHCTKLCVLAAATEGCEYDEHDPPADVGQHLRRGGYGHVSVETVFLTPENHTRKLVELAQRFERGEIDCFFNLCDGAWDEPSVGIGAVDLLENKLNLPFTGAGMLFFEPTRLEMKQVAVACGVLVPAWRFVYNDKDLNDLLLEFETIPVDGQLPLNFPLLVKHFSSYASIGLIKDSKVWNTNELTKQCNRMLSTYGGCLIEEFIEGREFTVLAAQEPAPDGEIQVVAFDPVECKFGEGEDFKHYNLKWIEYDKIGWRNVENLDPDLAERLKTLARNIFKGMRGRGYGRLDIRSDPTGRKLYFLEINPNCGICYPEGFYGSADFILDKVDPKKAHAKFIMGQVEVALRLWRDKNRKVIDARYDNKSESWGIHATKDMKVGDVILELEEKPMHLVSKSHVLQNWQKQSDSLNGDVEMRNWTNFAAYCWPVSDDLFVMWSPDPGEWKPLNHSCDPNAWNSAGNGLNVVARKPIRAGQEICMDYATFTGYFPEMKSFQCNCKSVDCRRLITGMDILNVDVACKYQGHMSSFIAAKAHEFHGLDATNDMNGCLHKTVLPTTEDVISN